MAARDDAVTLMRKVYAQPQDELWEGFARQALREGADALEDVLGRFHPTPQEYERVTALEGALKLYRDIHDELSLTSSLAQRCVCIACLNTRTALGEEAESITRALLSETEVPDARS